MFQYLVLGVELKAGIGSRVPHCGLEREVEGELLFFISPSSNTNLWEATALHQGAEVPFSSLREAELKEMEISSSGGKAVSQKTKSQGGGKAVRAGF